MSTRCVVPQKKMKAEKRTKIQLKCRSLRRRTNTISANGIE